MSATKTELEARIEELEELGNCPAAEFLWRSRSGSTLTSLPLLSAKCTGSRIAAQATASPACSGPASHLPAQEAGSQLRP